MKFPNYLKNVFAGLGIVSLIFYTCAAADEVASDNNNSPQIASGVYEHSLTIDGSYIVMTVLNTETGIIKTYARSVSTPLWSVQESSTIQVTH